MSNYDLVVIGAGPGGYVAAIRAAQLGKKVAVVEKKQLGGTCLNAGCIPSKTFLKHSEWLLTLNTANRYGIKNQVTDINIAKLVKRKCEVVQTLRNGIDYLFKKNSITLIKGEAQINEHQKVIVNGQEIQAKKILLATGSEPSVPPINGLDSVPYDTTDTFFDMQTLPKQLLIIGGGVIGVELAFSMAPLGVKTTIIEVAEDILLTEDKEAREIIKQELKRLNVDLFIGQKIVSIQNNLAILPNQKISFDKLLISTGRKANIGLAKNLGLQLTNNNKFVYVDEQYQTSIKNIYAIGDLIGNWMLAHAASLEGIVAVDRMFNHGNNLVNQNLIPRCVYSFPEIASVGLTEEEAKKQGKNTAVKKQLFATNGKAIAANETVGFIKIIIDKQYGEILGAVIVGSHATEMIHTIAAVIQAEGTVNDLADMCFAHPTLSEVIGETAKSLVFKAIH